MTQKVLFQGGINCLSNMAAYAIELDGELWMTVEHAYQAAKFADEGLHKEIKEARSAYDAKRIADEHVADIRESWFDERLSVMDKLVRLKVEQHPHILKRLLKSNPAEIVEDTDDSFWGRGQSGEGENHLGKLWMEIRGEYISKS
tara:strand:- start:33879 stop:34313 length:435 start_codon:yes stop_codon:yes gene_type:complete